MHILGEMNKAMDGARARARRVRAEDRDHQDPGRQDPRSDRLGGKVIREIVAKTGAKVDIDDDGTIKIAAADAVEDRGRHATGSSRSPRSRKSAQIYTARS